MLRCDVAWCAVVVDRGLVRIGGCVLFCVLLELCVVEVVGAGGGGRSNGVWAWLCAVVCVVFWVSGDVGAGAGVRLWLLLVDGVA